jgi:hypothetical protein
VQVELFDVTGELTSTRSVPLADSPGAPTTVEMQDALPVESFLSPMAVSKEAFTLAFEAIEPGMLFHAAQQNCR